MVVWVESLADDVVNGFNIEERLKGTNLTVENGFQGQQLSGDLAFNIVRLTEVFNAYVAPYPA